jgi:Ca2+-binding RTX toxin-like protein
MLRPTHIARVALAAAGLAFVLAVALTATNVVPSSRADASIGPGPTANELKPAACAALNLTVIVVGGGSGGQAALVLGTAGNDNLVGATQGDCLVGGAGNDRLNGGPGTDVCIGGAGTDTFQACETQIQ